MRATEKPNAFSHAAWRLMCNAKLTIIKLGMHNLNDYEDHEART